MRRLVLRIPDELGADLDAEAQRTKTTKSDVARRRLLAGGKKAISSRSHAGFALIRDLIGSDDTVPRDLSARKKHHLKARGFGRKKPRR